MRKYVPYNQTIKGDHTPEELEAVRQINSANAYLRSVHDVVDDCQANAPEGWMITAGWSTHEWDPEPEDIPAAENEPILMGLARVHHGDPQYPIWAWKKKDKFK